MAQAERAWPAPWPFAGGAADPLADQTADLLGHILLFPKFNRLDHSAAIERKWRFRPDD